MEVAVSQDCAIAFRPGQKEQNSVSKRKKKELSTYISFYPGPFILLHPMWFQLSGKRLPTGGRCVCVSVCVWVCVWVQWLMPVIPTLWEAKAT